MLTNNRNPDPESGSSKHVATKGNQRKSTPSNMELKLGFAGWEILPEVEGQQVSILEPPSFAPMSLWVPKMGLDPANTGLSRLPFG